MSSRETWCRPRSSARALPASTSCWQARGPAPQSIISRTHPAASGSFGRADRTRSSTRVFTLSGSGTRRTVLWQAMISSPLTTGSISAAIVLVVAVDDLPSSSRLG